jgi:hypothetical protein
MAPSGPTAEPVAPARKAWPRFPYKGLSYYGPEDAPLFTGRDKDVKACAARFCRRGVRVFQLHGKTGCGKSSFLRAGLIPFLEDPYRGFEFLKAEQGGQVKALFVRSTEFPLLKLAEAVYDFASSEQQVETVAGSVTLPLTRALPEDADRGGFCQRALRSPQTLIEALGTLSSLHPRTLVLVLDQAEEVLTQKPGPAAEESQARLFEFIGALTLADMDLKLLVTLRTDFFGPFQNGIRQRSTSYNPLAVDDYLLPELERQQLIEAILFPSSHKTVPGYPGVPHDHYRFTFEDKVPELIVNDLVGTKPAGGILPVMQIVCDRLYRHYRADDSRPRQEFVITCADYKRLGGIEGQVGKHLDEVLTRWCQSQGSDPRGSQAEVDRWKEVLFQLVETQAEGAVTTKLKRTEEVIELARNAGCRLDTIEATLSYLEDEKQRILRPTNLLNLETNDTLPGYSLGHDAIGLALVKWKVARETEKKTTTKLAALRGMNLILGVSLALVAAGAIVYELLKITGAAFAQSPATWEDWLAVVLSAFYLLIGVSMLMRPESYVRVLSVLLTSFNKNQADSRKDPPASP